MTALQDAAFEAGARAQRAEIARRYRAQAEKLKERGDPNSRKTAAFVIVLAAEIAAMPLVQPEAGDGA